MKCSQCHADVSNDSLYCSKCGANLIASDMQITRSEHTHQLKNKGGVSLKPDDAVGDRYRIIGELGKGGMGQVFHAFDNELGIDVALKMIRPEFLMNRNMIARFKKEILLAREITHENVSRIHDFGEFNGIKFISMEYIRGKTLKDIVRNEGPVSPEKARGIAIAICSGLDAAHKKGIVHRDLKPQNIMIDDKEQVYITDFGLAKSLSESDVSHTGLVIGTPQYIPPELWKGEVADNRSDIYSLGIIMFEMITGEELFRSESDYGYLQKHVNEDPEFPESVRDKIPSFLKSIILRCLAKERQDRYQNCRDIARDLNDRIFTRGTFIGGIERSIRKTGPVKIGISVALLFILSFIGALMLKKGPPDPKKRSVAILYFKNLSGDEKLDHFSFSLPELLTTDLGQSKYIRVLPDDRVSEALKDTGYLSSNMFDQKLFMNIGEKAKVNYLVQGSFIRSGNDLRVTVKLRDADTGEMLSTDYQDATMDNIFPAVDRLTTGLKKRFDLTENEIFGDIDSEIESITTSSQDALNHYITGKRLYNERKFEESLSEFQKAVDIDPAFAMAYRNMAWSYAMLDDWDNRKKFFEKAISFIHKMSEREKYLIYGDYYGEAETTYQRSIDSYKKILEIYPDDYEANFQIGLTYRVIEEWDPAVEHLSIACDADKTRIEALDELVFCLENLGEYPRAEQWIHDFVQVNQIGENDKVLSLLYRVKLRQNRYDEASKIVARRNRLSEKDQSGMVFNEGQIQVLKGDYDAAARTIRSLRNGKYDSPSLEELKYYYLFRGQYSKFEHHLKKQIREADYIGWENVYKAELIYFYISAGLNDKASELLNTVDPESETDDPTRLAILLGLEIQNEIDRGNLEKSKNLMDDLKILNEKVFAKIPAVRRLDHIMGKFYEKSGNTALAEEYYTRSLNGLGNRLSYRYAAPYYYNTARFYFRLGQWEKAEDLFRHIHRLSEGRLYRGDLYARSFYYLGKIYQKKGLTDKAIESYRAFYQMWKDGDPGFAGKYISDTEEQLKILGGGI